MLTLKRIRVKKLTVNLYNGTNCYNAGSKAIADFLKILSSKGYRILSFRIPIGKSKAAKLYLLIRDVLKGYCTIPRGARVVYVYPDILQYDFLFPLLALKKHRKTAIVCDIDSLRCGSGELSREDFSRIDRFDEIIVHTPMMKEVLVKAGMNPGKLKVIDLFDYLAERPYTGVRRKSNRICYAGNLDKSIFLRRLPLLYETEDRTVGMPSFNLYGIESPNLPRSEHIVYKGKFHPDDLSGLEGSWGLVWDGDTPDTCGGPFGNYLRVNIPHKTCLYLSACMPVIIWKEAALAPLIEKNKLGIAVNSLYEIPERIASIPEEEYDQMFRNVQEYSAKLRNGEMLEKMLE